jgi:hypothetical protein
MHVEITLLLSRKWYGTGTSLYRRNMCYNLKPLLQLQTFVTPSNLYKTQLKTVSIFVQNCLWTRPRHPHTLPILRAILQTTFEH